MDVLIPVNDSIPAWYELSWRKNKLIILIHQAAFEVLKKDFPQEQPLIDLLQNEFSLPDFIFLCEGNFGFGGALKFIGVERGCWLAWECIVPQKNETPEKWHEKMRALRATLAVLFSRLQFLYVDADTGCKELQLILVESFEVISAYLSAVLTPAMTSWIAKQGNCRLAPVADAMKSMSRRLVKANDACGGFQVDCRLPKWIELHVPGNACCLSPYSYADESLERGYALHPHNLDGPAPQIEFLAGLAKLHDLARAG
jgi:hypothetical protein